MTEETLTNLDIEEVARDKARAQEKSERAVRRGYVIGLLFLAASILSAMANFVEFRAWQILVVSLADIASFVLLFQSFIHFRNNRQREAHNLIPIAILLTFTFNEIFYSGNLTYNFIGGLILFTITYLFFEPEDRRRWFRYAIAHTGLVLIFGIMSFLPKFAPDQDTINFAITSATFVLMIWQLLRRFQIRSIRTRLMLIMLGVTLLPLLLAGGVSIIIDLQRDTTQAENLLAVVSNGTSRQISDLLTSIGDDLGSIDQNPYMVANTQILTQFTPTEATRQQIEDGISTIFRQKVANSEYYQNISLLNISGDVLISTNEAMVGQNLQTVEGLSAALINQIKVDPSVDSLGITQARIFVPLSGEDGVIMAVLMADINFNLVFPILTDAADFLGETGEGYLVNNQNQLVSPAYQESDAEPGTYLNLPEIEAGEQMVTGEALVQNYTNLVGSEVIGTRQTILGLNGYLVVEQAEDEAFNSLRLSTVINSVISIFGLIIAVIFAVIVSRNFAAPIEKISKTARRVLRGEQTTFPEIDRVDEIGTLTNTLSEMTSQLLATTVNLEQTVAERTEVLERRATYLETTSQISRATTGIYELTALLNTVAQLISENFGFYHVGIFINDERDEFSVLRASNSEGGWKMLARGHKLEIGAQGIVGYVTGTGEPRVQQQVVGEDSVYFDNPDLPLTRSEMALPLKVGDDTFGALDVQSEEEQAFSDEDVTVLQTLADAVAVTIQNTRLIEQLQENLEAERRLFGEITKETWTTMLSRGQQGFSVRSDVRGTQMVTSPSTETGMLAMKEQMPIIGNLDEELHAYPAALPVTVRGGATIGVIETQKPEAEGPWTQEEISILEKVSSELGLALDNARLFEETQRRAQRDRIAADLSTKIWSSSDVENILQTAVSELGSALNVSQGQIRLSLQDGDTPEPDEEIENITDGVNQS